MADAVTPEQPPAVLRRPLRFHWTSSSVDDQLQRFRPHGALPGIPDFASQVQFCNLLAQAGVDSVLLPINLGRPDPITWAVALGQVAGTIRFMCGARPGIYPPAFLVQQVNTAAAVTGGRICLNAIIGHNAELHANGDRLDHDSRYTRADEFWRICRALWTDEQPVTFSGAHYAVEQLRVRTRFASPAGGCPEIYFGGNSAPAEAVALRYGSCLLQLPRPPAAMAPIARRLAAGGVELGIIVAMMVRPTRAEAVRAAQAMVDGVGDLSRQLHRQHRDRTDSVAYRSMYALGEAESPWITQYLWSGAVPYLGAPAIALVGGPAEIVDAVWEYREAGVNQFMFTGWPDRATVTVFAREILPELRRREAAALLTAARGSHPCRGAH